MVHGGPLIDSFVCVCILPHRVLSEPVSLKVVQDSFIAPSSKGAKEQISWWLPFLGLQLLGS